MRILEWLLFTSFESGYLIIEGSHVLIMVPLLVTELGVDPLMCSLESVSHIGLAFLKSSL